MFKEPGQIPLQFGHYQQFDFDSFIAGENTEVITQLRKVATNHAQHHIYLWGDDGLGKSHLLQAACKLASENQLQVAHVPLSMINEFSPDMLHDLGMLDLVCVDDLDCLKGDVSWQQSMVWLYNELRDSRHSLIMAASVKPKRLSLDLQDLQSRLEWDLVLQLKPPDEVTKINILKDRAKARAFELPDDVIEYMIRRVNRDLPSLIMLLDRIDHASLAEKRRVTVPLIKKVLDRL